MHARQGISQGIIPCQGTGQFKLPYGPCSPGCPDRNARAGACAPETDPTLSPVPIQPQLAVAHACMAFVSSPHRSNS